MEMEKVTEVGEERKNAEGMEAMATKEGKTRRRWKCGEEQEDEARGWKKRRNRTDKRMDKIRRKRMQRRRSGIMYDSSGIWLGRCVLCSTVNPYP